MGAYEDSAGLCRWDSGLRLQQLSDGEEEGGRDAEGETVVLGRGHELVVGPEEDLSDGAVASG